MYIGSTLADCLLNHGFYKLYNRGVINVLTVHVLFFFHGFFFFGIFVKFGQHVLLTIVFINCHQYTLRSSHNRLYLKVRDDIDVIRCRHIHRVSHGNTDYVHSFRRIFKRKHCIFFQNINRNQALDILRNHNITKVNHIIMQLTAKRLCNSIFSCKSCIHKCKTKSLLLFFLKFKALHQLFLCDSPIIYQYVTKTHFSSHYIHS